VPRPWTVPDANAAIPALTALLESVRVAVGRRHDRPDLEGGDPRLVLSGATSLLQTDGIVLRDLDQGLIDFEALAPSGRRYWLCWVLGEPAVTWWHWPEDGFAGRTPLESPPP
jgi:Uncharacterized conserved protein (DUF2203)